ATTSSLLCLDVAARPFVTLCPYTTLFRSRLWSPADPHLYDLMLTLLDASGQVVDQVKSYAGLRSVSINGKAVQINGQTIFQRLRSEEHTSELQSRENLVCRLLLEKKNSLP